MKKNKFQLKREATYKLLLEAGIQCFSEKGYASTTLGDIVARIGHTKGAFYGHFENKEQFFFHILDYQFEITDGWTKVPLAYSPANTSLEEVISHTLAGLGQMLNGVNNWIVVLADFHQQVKHHPEHEKKLKEKYVQWVADIEDLVAVLQERGWIAQEKDTRMIAVQVIAFNEGYSIFSSLFGGSNPQALIQGLVKLMS